MGSPKGHRRYCGGGPVPGVQPGRTIEANGEGKHADKRAGGCRQDEEVEQLKGAAGQDDIEIPE